MKLPIYAYGHAVLRKKCEEINKDYPELSTLLENMWETMYHAKGMGLAAPQIGKNIRLFVVDTAQLESDEDDEDFDDGEPEYENGIKSVFINPVIVAEAGKKWAYEEGCLSIPEIRGKVDRQPQIRVQYLDENFELHDDVFDGLNARVIQHEYDHIQGVLFTDHLSALKKRLIKKKLDKIQTGAIETKYKMVFSK